MTNCSMPFVKKVICRRCGSIGQMWIDSGVLHCIQCGYEKEIQKVVIKRG